MRLDPEESVLEDTTIIDSYKESLLETYKYTGQRVKSRYSGKIGVILRVTPAGCIQVLERIEPLVICTHDDMKDLEFIDKEIN